MLDWRRRKVTILGFGKSGASAAGFLSSRGASVFVSDAVQTPDPSFAAKEQELKKAGVQFEFGKHTDKALKFSDLIIVSPGIAPHSEIIRRAKALDKEIICDIELAFREIAFQNLSVPIIGVTGTNGKSTTTALISHILSTAGKSAPACGNFGIPVCSQLTQHHDYLVVEVSSFQLAYCKNFAPLFAVWLNFTPDHLEWHGGLKHYEQAKLRIFANQTSKDFAILNVDDPVVKAAGVNSQRIEFSTRQTDISQGALLFEGQLAYRLHGKTEILCKPEELQIKGAHNVENALAAVSVCILCDLNPEQIKKGLLSFKSLEHRLEYSGTINGIAFYNDSKATNVSSTLKALDSFPQEKIVLIAGGRDKGTELIDFVQAVKHSASAVILLGEASERFTRALKEGGFTSIYTVKSLEQAVDLGSRLNSGPVVLSPACASYDMFKNYEERGRVFKDLVKRKA